MKTKFKKEIMVIENGNENKEKWFEVYTNTKFLPEEIEEVAIYELKEIKKLIIKRELK